MSFKKMDEEELTAVAEAFAVDFTDATTKEEKLAALTEEGVTFKQWQAMQEAPQVDPAELVKPKEATAGKPKKHDPTGDEVLIRMRRDNFKFQAFGVTFTKEHPFAVVPRRTANHIFETFEGFTSATPRELEEYYSKG